VRRLVRRTIAGLIAAGVTGGVLVLAGPAHAAFTTRLGGEITRAEVIERAQYWVDHQPGPYGSQYSAPGPTGDRNYRRDCSGFVDMAWHLNSDPATQDLPNISTEIPRVELTAGDILDDTGTHVLLFDAWQADRVHFTYYSFGSTPVKHVTASIYDAQFDGHPNSAYRAFRYNHITGGGVSAVLDGGLVRVFARGADGALWQAYWDGDWHWNLVGGQITGAPAAVVDGSVVRVFARGADGALWEALFDGQWHWQSIGGQITDGPAVTLANGMVTVFARGADGTVWQAYDNGQWRWQSVGGSIVGSPAVVAGNGVVRVFARGADSALWQASYDGQWHWQSIGGEVTDGPGATLDGSVVRVFARGTDGAMWQASFDGQWNWQSVGGRITGVPGVFATNGVVRVFARGADGAVWQASTNGQWPWQSIGGRVT
jgi:hypothetical protein